MQTTFDYPMSHAIPRPSRIKAWIALQELPKHLANLLPFALGTVLAWWQAGQVDWSIFAISIVGLFFDGWHVRVQRVLRLRERQGELRSDRW
ncbi:MAG: hypothetical protein U0163_16615 [Gemmatimonadaceae bacterium]